jgi:hypothetical protein
LAATLAAEEIPNNEVSIRVLDETGSLRPSVCELAGRSGRLTQSASNGSCVFRDLPAGEYAVRVVSVGFTPATLSVRVKSTSRINETVSLKLATVATKVEVSGAGQEGEPGNATRLGTVQLETRTPSNPGRDVVNIVKDQPGWLFEANGVLHPRGSEYDTQFIVDGVPLLENRSPAFAPPYQESIQAMEFQTAGYPAAYGRQLGGVVTLESREQVRRGWHGTTEVQVGSFDSQQVSAQIGFGDPKNSLELDGSGLRTNRYLDPPTLENYHNAGDAEGGEIRFTHGFNEYRRLTVEFRGGRSGFEVPNEEAQQLAGQQQARRLREWSGQVWYQQVLTPNWLVDLHVSGRDMTGNLESNALAVPIFATQDRSLREFYGSGSVTGHIGRHEISTGVDLVRPELDEKFQYAITDPSAFDPGVKPSFAFAGARTGIETASYLQDHITAGPLTANVGLRWDYYDLLVRATAWSPRLAAAWRIKPLGLTLKASYDRIFNTPATENLLLASSADTHQVSSGAQMLPVPPARANFYEVGAVKNVGGGSSVGVSAYRRDFTNFHDDDVFLNTGISFPIAFSSAEIEGIEADFRMQFGRNVSTMLSYSNLSGWAQLPVTGGLLLEGSAELLQSNDVVRISQDQRNTVALSTRVAAGSRVWFGFDGNYGSGLPVEVDNNATLTNDTRILQRVNFERGRLRPSFSLGASTGVVLWKRELQKAEVQVGVTNFTDQLNVINFAGVFSGTAIDAPRAVNVKFRYSF